MNCSLAIYNFDPNNKETRFTYSTNENFLTPGNHVANFGGFYCREQMTVQLNDFIRTQIKYYNTHDLPKLPENFYMRIGIAKRLGEESNKKLSNFFSSFFGLDIIFTGECIYIKLPDIVHYKFLFIPSFLVWYMNISNYKERTAIYNPKSTWIIAHKEFIISVYKLSPLHAYFLWIHDSYKKAYQELDYLLSICRFNGPVQFTCGALPMALEHFSYFFQYTGMNPDEVKNQGLPPLCKKWILYETEYLENHKGD